MSFFVVVLIVFFSVVCGIVSGFFAYIAFVNIRRFNLGNLITSILGFCVGPLNFLFTGTEAYGLWLPAIIYLTSMLITTGVSHYLCARIGSKIVARGDIRNKVFFRLLFLGIVLEALEPSHAGEIRDFLGKLSPYIIKSVFGDADFSYAYTILEGNKLHYVAQGRDVERPFELNASIAGVSLLKDEVFVMPDDQDKCISHSIINQGTQTRLGDLEAGRSGQNINYVKYLCVPIIDVVRGQKSQLGVIHIDTLNASQEITDKQRKDLKNFGRMIAPIFSLLKAIREQE